MQQRDLPLETVLAALRAHPDRLETALVEAQNVPDGVAVRCTPVALVVGWKYGIPIVLTVMWAVKNVPANLHHIPTGIEAVPVLCIHPPAFEALLEHGIPLADLCAALRQHPRKFIAAASLATPDCAIRFTAAPFLLALGQVQGYPNLLTVYRA
jgi:hypothetical protein